MTGDGLADKLKTEFIRVMIEQQEMEEMLAGVDCVLILLQERFFWPKISNDVCKYIRMCKQCICFKFAPERDEMYTISASYPLELIHFDFLTSKKDKNKNVLVITDHFTCYT